MREQLRLRDVAEASPEGGDARPEEVQGNEADGAVGQDVEGGRAARVGPAGAAEKGEGAEDRRAHDEVHHQEAERTISGDVTLGAPRRTPAGKQPDRQRDRQISERDGDNDDPVGH